MACIVSASDGAAAAHLTSLRVRTTAPEVLAGGCVSEKSDVWWVRVESFLHNRTTWVRQNG